MNVDDCGSFSSNHRSHDGDEKFESEAFKRKQMIKPTQCGLERHSSFHDSLVGILPTRPKPKEEKPGVRHRMKCRRKPRHEPPVMETAEDSALKFRDDRPGVEPKVQAKPAGDGSLKQSNFKSKAVYCEVKLMELLGKAGPQTRLTTPGKYEDAPDVYRASVCCLMLAEIRDMDTPYSRVLHTILQNLEQAIYSNYITPHAGGTFDQVPYFEIVGRLEAQHQGMLEQQELWKTMLSENQASNAGLQQRIKESNDLLVNEKTKVTVLQKDLQSTQSSLRKATEQAAELDHELTQSKALVLDASNVKAQYEEEVSKYEDLHARYVDLTEEVQRLQQDLAVSRQEAADGVSKELFNNLQNDFYDLETKLQAAQEFERLASTMIPRPNWAEIRGGSFLALPTSQQATEVGAENRKLEQRNLDLEAQCAAATVALAEATQPRIVEKKKGKEKGKEKGQKGKKK